MITKGTLYLIALCQTLLEDKISVKNFCEEFERFYCYDETETISDDENAIWFYLMKAVALYQPSASIRSEEQGLIDDNELKRRIQEALYQLGNLK